jgi:anti-sigma factor RsiW
MDRTDPRHDPPLSESDIQAYADGLLPPERAAHLRDYLGERPGEARRVAFYGRLNEQIQRSFGPPDEQLPGRAAADPGTATTTTTVAPRTAAGNWLRRRGGAGKLRASLKLILAAALALVALSGWLAASQISRQALNNAAVMALMEVSSGHVGDASTLVDRSAPDLTSVGMHLVSRRTLKLGPFSQVTEYVYRTSANQPVVLLKGAAWFARAQPQWSAHRAGSLRLLEWTAHGERVVLAGTADARGLMRAADTMTLQ